MEAGPIRADWLSLHLLKLQDAILVVLEGGMMVASCVTPLAMVRLVLPQCCRWNGVVPVYASDMKVVETTWWWLTKCPILMCTDTATENNECGVRDDSQNRERECRDGEICVLQHTLNVCVPSKFLDSLPHKLLPQRKQIFLTTPCMY